MHIICMYATNKIETSDLLTNIHTYAERTVRDWMHSINMCYVRTFQMIFLFCWSFSIN